MDIRVDTFARTRPQGTQAQCCHGAGERCSDGGFGKRDRRDQRLVRKQRRIIQPAKHDDRARVEDPRRLRSRQRGQRIGNIVAAWHLQSDGMASDNKINTALTFNNIGCAQIGQLAIG